MDLQTDNSSGNLCLDESLIKPQLSENSDTQEESKPNDVGSKPGEEHKSVFDLVKSGARRMSSAKALSFEDHILKHGSSVQLSRPPPALGKDSISVAAENDIKMHARISNSVKSTCTVKCEPLSSLPLEVVGQETFILKKSKYW